ncbi:MAG: leucine-rich repeat domain-containing protein [Lachnospiraceae bacterium]|nr:leucine-rich repeat domain-containing protein [Lachnospiraceae bacterium]
MKKKLLLFMTTVVLLTTPACVSFASDTTDVIIVEDEESIETETEVSINDEVSESLIMSVEVTDEPSDEPATISAASSGTWGNNLTWTLDSAGTFTISGSGAMDSYRTDSFLSLYDEFSNGFIEPSDSTWPIGGIYKSIKKIVIENGITSIAEDSFVLCSNLTSISIPNSVTSIGRYAFTGCSSLTSITIPDSVTEIGDYAFYSCTSLSAVSLGSGLTSIGMAAFLDCDSLTSITVPKSVTEIGWMAIGYKVFSSATGTGGEPVAITIKGYKGSAAETYAAESEKFTFITLDNSAATLGTCSISSLTNVAKGIKIKWSQVSGASGYIIYRKTGSGSYKKIKTITSASTVSYTDKKVVDKNGKTYTYKVVPYSGSTEGTGSEKTMVRLTGTTLTSVKNSAASKAKVKWTAVTSVTGYQIQYSISSSFSSYKTKKVSGATSVSKTLSSLTKGNTYYVRIRTYKTVDGTTYYSAWSGKLKVKITK